MLQCHRLALFGRSGDAWSPLEVKRSNWKRCTWNLLGNDPFQLGKYIFLEIHPSRIQFDSLIFFSDGWFNYPLLLFWSAEECWNKVFLSIPQASTKWMSNPPRAFNHYLFVPGVSSLKLTAKAPENGWLEVGIRVSLLVLGRIGSKDLFDS